MIGAIVCIAATQTALALAIQREKRKEVPR